MPQTSRLPLQISSFPTYLLLLTAALLGFVAPSFAQGDAAPSQFADIVDVRVVNLEIVVERRGQRIEGLSPDDFRLLVDGQEFPIEYFSEIRYGSAVAPLAGGETLAVPALAPGEDVGTSFLVFIDDVFSIGPYRNRVLDGLRKQTELLGPKDRMAIVAYDGRQIEMLTSWTRSGSEIERALEEARERPTKGLLRRSLQRSSDELGFYTRTSLQRDLDQYSTSYFDLDGAFLDLQGVVDAATASLRGFANPPGRKVMLMLSGGWDPTIWGWNEFSSRVDYGGPRPESQLYGPVVDTANRLGYTLYPVEVSEVEAPYVDASIGNIRQASYVRERRRQREWNREGVLHLLARETGGRAYFDGASRNVLQNVQDDTASYYWLGFTPDWKANDERHRIEVEYLGQGKVRSRRSFSDLSRRTETTMQMESAQLFDLPLASVADLAVHVGEPQSSRFRRVVVPVEIEIPLDQVTLLPQADGWAGQVELRVAVTDDRGDRADIPVVPVNIFLEDEPGPGETRTFETGLKMRKRPHRLLISLHDPISGETRSTKLDVSL